MMESWLFFSKPMMCFTYPSRNFAHQFHGVALKYHKGTRWLTQPRAQAHCTHRGLSQSFPASLVLHRLRGWIILIHGHLSLQYRGLLISMILAPPTRLDLLRPLQHGWISRIRCTLTAIHFGVRHYLHQKEQDGIMIIKDVVPHANCSAPIWRRWQRPMLKIGSRV